MGDVDDPFQQLEAAKKKLIMEFKENAKSAQELEFWNRMEIVRDNYPNSQEDSSSGDTSDEEQVEGVNLTKGKKTDEKVPDTSDETKQEKSAAGERADEEKSLKEHTVTFKMPEMEHGAGDDKPLPQKDFMFQNDGMEHDFNHNATRDESLINLFENEDSNGLVALQLTEDKLEINETDNKTVLAEKTNGCKVVIKDLFKAAKKTAKMEAKELKRKQKMEARETERKRKQEEIELKKKIKMEAQESQEKKTRAEKEIKKKRKMEKKKAKNQKKYEKCVSKGVEYDLKIRRKEEKKSSQEKIISEAKQYKQKTKIDQNESKEKKKPETNDKKEKEEHKSNREKLIIEIKELNGKVVKEKKELKAQKSAVEGKMKTNKLHEKKIAEAGEFDGKGKPGAKETKLNEKLKSKEFKEKMITGEAKPVNKPKLMDFVRSLVGYIRNRY
ncbi:Hypothetical predicted protein [Mytilus galloprovincialis]|uniref:Uncharacterized protein n=1 Tax=Mytilus galloprovincialis TaxID=29158 RepID=A0A8B6GG51_MYTGA|nr:Hypothetical predicted protein [Mytilus galloprovincialis]